MTVDEIIELATDPLGGGPYTGDKLRKAKTHLQLVIVDLLNRSVPLSFLAEKTFQVSQDKVNLDSAIRKIGSIVDSTQNIKSELNQVTLYEFNSYNNTINGKPTIWAEHRLADNLELRLYPTPDKTYTYTAYVELDPTRIEFYDDALSIHSTYLPAILAGLTARLAEADATIGLDAKQLAMGRWKEARDEAIDADRETAPLFLRPDLRRR